MSLLEIEETHRDYNHMMYKLHSHNYFELYYLIEGERKFFIENSLYNIKPNTMVIIPPFIMHKTEGSVFKRVVIYFAEDILSKDELKLLKKVEEQRIFALSQTKFEEYKNLFKYLIDLKATGAKFAKEILKIKLLNLIAELYQATLNKDFNIKMTHLDKSTSSVVLKIIEYINANYTKELTLKEIADIFFISSGHLSRLFKSQTGFSINDYILNLRINLAKTLLATTNKSIEDITYAIGFSSANYFSLMFKKKVGLSPLNFKKIKYGQNPM